MTSTTRFTARKTHVCSRDTYPDLKMDQTHYSLFLGDHPHTVGSMRHCEKGWIVWSGGLPAIAFRVLNKDRFFPTAAEALADFRAQFEAAEGRAATARAHAFATVRDAGLPPVEWLADWAQEDGAHVEMKWFNPTGYRADEGTLTFLCSPAEAFAFMAHPDLHVEPVAVHAVVEGAGQTRIPAEWCIPGGRSGKWHMHIRSVGSQNLICRNAGPGA